MKQLKIGGDYFYFKPFIKIDLPVRMEDWLQFLFRPYRKEKHSLCCSDLSSNSSAYPEAWIL